MIFELFAVGTLWFWGFILFAIIWEIVTAANELYGATWAGLLVFLGVLQWGTSLNPWSSVVGNPGWALVGVAGYIVLGILWMIWKWRCYVLKEVDDANNYNRKVCIHVDNHKAELMSWASMWPFSLLAYFLTDMVKNFFEGIYRHMRNWLQGMANRLVTKYSRIK